MHGESDGVCLQRYQWVDVKPLCFACLLGQSQLRAKGWVSVLPRSGKAEEWEKVYVLLHPWEVMGGDG